MVVGGCGWLWVVVAGFGWFWLVVGRCGWFWLVPRFSMYAIEGPFGRRPLTGRGEGVPILTAKCR